MTGTLNLRQGSLRRFDERYDQETGFRIGEVARLVGRHDANDPLLEELGLSAPIPSGRRAVTACTASRT